MYLKAQEQNFPFQNFQNITTANGLSYNEVLSLIQDHNGFMWFATSYGLCRYDGYNFKNYYYNTADSNSISPGYYYSMFEDKNGIIWLCSTTQGFYSFNPVTEKFKHYHHQKGNINSLASDGIEGGFVQDSSGIIWIGTPFGLNSFNPGTNHFELFTHHDGDSTTLSSNANTWICIDEENNLWYATSDNSIDYFNTQTKKIIAHFPAGCSALPGNKKTSTIVIPDKSRNGNILVSTNDNGFYVFNIHKKSWTHFVHDEKNPSSLSSNNVGWLYEDHNGNFWISIDGGLDFYENETGKFYHTVPNSIGNFSSFSVAMFLEDKEHKIWMATNGLGIVTCEPVNKKFISFRNDATNKNSLGSGNVACIFQKQPGELFFGSSKGVFVFNEKYKTIQPFALTENGKNILADNITCYIYRDSKNTLWFCTLNGLFSYNEQSKQLHSFRTNENDSTTLSGHSANGIIEDEKGNYWVTSFGGGLNYLDSKTGKFKRFMVHDRENSISSNGVAVFFKDNTGNFNIGSMYGGLVTFNPSTGKFKNYLHLVSDSTSISADITTPYLQGKNNIIWLGTLGGGLNAFNPATGKFRAFTVKDGLPSNAVVSMIKDDDGKAWIGTYKGISCCTLPENPFDKNCKVKFRNYDVNDGLPSNDLGPWSALKADDGNLYFGTTNAGLFYFNPKDLKDNTFIPPVYITDFSLMNKPVTVNDSNSVLKIPIEFTQEIVLNYKQNILSFTFAALNFLHPEKNKYAYKLEGYNKDWIYTDATKRFATYTNLDPGEYVFKVKATNNDGLWNETPTELKISITPPFWKTVWFRLLAILLVAVAVYAFIRNRLMHILKLQTVRNKIAADLHDDIGSTLNSISIFSEVARKDASKRDHAMLMIGESSRKVIDSMSDIVWSINPQNDSFDKIIFRMRSLTYNLLKAKKIDCAFHADESLNELKLEMETRKNFYLIFKEALNNLVKYSEASRASVLISHQRGSVTCIVRDDGIGFNINNEYTGNGITNMKKRAEEINALFSIESSDGKGTSVMWELGI